MKQITSLLALFCLLISSSCSTEEPEPTYNWWTLLSVNQYNLDPNTNELIWRRETKHEEKYELNKTESYIKEQQAKYDGKKGSSGNHIYIWTYTYKKVDYIPVSGISLKLSEQN